MDGRTVLGRADVSDDTLRRLVAARLGLPDVEVASASAEVAPYDLDALTTGGRFWVRGTATHAGGDTPYSFFVKVVQSWSRSQSFLEVPKQLREMAEAALPWRNEPAVYRSDLGHALPVGVTMPAAYAVIDIDEKSAAIWMEAIEVASPCWDSAMFARAAFALGRLAASRRVAPFTRLGTENSPRQYAASRVKMQLEPMLRDEGFWRHPVVSAVFGVRGRASTLAVLDTLPSLLAELDALPVTSSHGDACPRNILVATNRPDELVLIDFGFWGSAPVGFDLCQLLLGDVQTGERSAGDLPALHWVCLDSYWRGLLAEGLDVSIEQVRRGAAIWMAIFYGLAAVPTGRLRDEPSDELVDLMRERAAAADWVFDQLNARPANAVPARNAGSGGYPS